MTATPLTPTTAKIEIMLAAVDAAYVRRSDIEHCLTQSRALDAEERNRRQQPAPDLDAKRAELLALAQRKFYEVLAEHGLLPTV